MLLCLCLPAAVEAQTESADAIKDLRRKTDWTSEELAALDRFIEDSIATMEAQADNPKAGARFQERILATYNHAENSSRFKQEFARRCSASFASKMKNGPDPSRRSLIYTLGAMADPATVDALLEAVTAPDPATRALAVETIVKMRQILEADPARISTVIARVSAAAPGEQNVVVLRRLYKAVSFDSKRDEQVAALIRILESRIQHYQNDTVRAEAAELVAYDRLLALSADCSENQRKRLVRLLAQYLVYYTDRYLNADLRQTNRTTLQRLIFMLEKLLGRAVGVGPDDGGVAAVIGSLADDREAQIRSALTAWVGSKEGNGRLNGPQWQVPVGGGAANIDINDLASDRSSQPAASSQGGSP